jgi:hypothetical protein
MGLLVVMIIFHHSLQEGFIVTDRESVLQLM